MKTVFIFTFFCVSIANTFAQDVITLRNGDEIKALVQEIGDEDVKYKMYENPNGPNYTLKKSGIFMIRYANGSRDVFTDNAAPVTSAPANPSARTNQQNGQNWANQQQNPAIDYVAFTQLKRNDAAMEAFLRQNDAALYNQFHKGVKLRRSGKGLLISGLIVTGAGLGLMVVGLMDTDDYGEVTEDGLIVASTGYLGIIVGQTLTVASIPLSIVGKNLKKRAVNSYEEKYFSNRTSYQPSLDFVFTGNGLGLALKF